MRKAEIAGLVYGHARVCYQVRLAWDGSGDYIIAVLSHGNEGERDEVLCHEDGAPLRFRDAARAHAMARHCGLVTRSADRGDASSAKHPGGRFSSGLSARETQPPAPVSERRVIRSGP